MTTYNQAQLQQPSSQGFLKSEDWWAVWLGFFISLLGAGKIWNLDILGWVSKYGTWLDFNTAIQANSQGFASLGGFGSSFCGVHVFDK